MIKRFIRNPIENKQLHTQPVKPALFHLINKFWLLGSLLFIVMLTIYYPALNGASLWDDDHHMTRPELRSLNGLGRIWTELGATQQYYPLVHSVFWLEYHLWGGSTVGYHLLNILLHVLSSVLLFKILQLLKIPGAWLASAIFALHPIQVETVAWITELKNTLSGVFFFSAALVYLKFDSERKRKLYVIAISLFILGLMSKSVIATLPVSLLAIIWWKRGEIDWKKDLIPLLPFFVVGIAYGLFTAWVEHKFIIGNETSQFTTTIIERCLIAGRATWFYLSKIFLPVDLIFIYPHWNISQAVWWQYLFPAATLLIAAIFWLVRKRSRAPLIIFICFTATLFPALGFFNVFSFQFSYVADHFQYLSCIGPITLSAALVNQVTEENRKLRIALVGILLFALGLLTWKQSMLYADPEILYRSTVQKNPQCWMAYNNLGIVLSKRGLTNEAIADYRKALQLKPDYNIGINNLGTLLAKTGQIREAVEHYQNALLITPKNAQIYYSLGILFLKIGRTDDAIADFKKALEIDPKYIDAYNNLGIVLAESGRMDEGIEQFQLAFKINPNKINTLINLGSAFARKGQLTDAISLIEKALSLAKSEGDETQAREIGQFLDGLNRASR
jgi:tetratricopeptide (TPR) repeat protein